MDAKQPKISPIAKRKQKAAELLRNTPGLPNRESPPEATSGELTENAISTYSLSVEPKPRRAASEADRQLEQQLSQLAAGSNEAIDAVRRQLAAIAESELPSDRQRELMEHLAKGLSRLWGDGADQAEKDRATRQAEIAKRVMAACHEHEGWTSETRQAFEQILLRESIPSAEEWDALVDQVAGLPVRDFGLNQEYLTRLKHLGGLIPALYRLHETDGPVVTSLSVWEPPSTTCQFDIRPETGNAYRGMRLPPLRVSPLVVVPL